MRTILHSALGSAFLSALAMSSAMADQIPSAIATEGSYHLSPHRPETGDAPENDGTEMPRKPAESGAASGLVLMPHKSAIVENPVGYSMRPHRPDPGEMPAMAAPVPLMQREPTAASQPQPRANPAANATPNPATVAPASPNSQQASPATPAPDVNGDLKKREGWRYRHLPRPYNPNMQLNPMMGLGAACMNGSVTICGKTVPVPAGPIGAVANLTAPFPYLPQTFEAQCLAVNGIPSYRIIDATQVTCEAQSCAPSDVIVCGTAINVPASAKVGSALKVPIPTSILANPATTYNMNLHVRCGEGPDAVAIYRVENEAQISCNQFPCQTSNVRLCNAAIEVPGGSPLGTVLTLTMPPPFAPDQFAVQCLGSMGRQPVYQVIDHAGVGCNRLDGR